MTWTWNLSTPISDPDIQTELDTGWPTQDDAEEWLRGSFDLLLDEGVESVTLKDCCTEIYSMSLEPQA